MDPQQQQTPVIPTPQPTGPASSQISEQPQGQPVGALSDAEKQILVARTKANMNLDLILLIVCLVFVFLFFTIFLAILMYLRYSREKLRLNGLQSAEVPIYRISGTVTLDPRWGPLGQIWMKIGDFTLPEYTRPNDPVNSWKDQHIINSNVTSEYLPTVNLIRCYYDQAGNGYSYINRAPFKKA